MIGKLLAHLLGNPDEEVADPVGVDETCEDLVEFEEGGWVIVKTQENLSEELPDEGALEMLFEHPSISVYQMSDATNEEENLESDGEESQSASPEPVRRHVSWRLAAWGSPLPGHINLVASPDRKRLTKNALHRQNLARMRYYPADRRYGHFKQPSQRLYNY